jgi:ADP-ribose pyrophosphatase YjhB (NUDIX family)
MNRGRFNNIYSVIAVVTPKGIPLVRDFYKVPSYWKFPGGHGEGSESPEDCAWRELFQETGIGVDFFELEKIHDEEKVDHKLFFFMITKSEAPKINAFGDGGEQVDYFTLERIQTMSDFFPSHLHLLRILQQKITNPHT